jgi:hypothetical protein
MTYASRICGAGRRAYSGFIPTMTASGVPHSALSPVRLLRQIITMFLAGGRGGGGEETIRGCSAAEGAR